MSGVPANAARGECALRVNGCDLVLRPSFQALVAAAGLTKVAPVLRVLLGQILAGR